MKIHLPPEEYLTEITQIGRWTYEVQLITRLKGGLLEFSLEQAPIVLGPRWAAWKARRMLAACRRDDQRRKNRVVIK